MTELDINRLHVVSNLFINYLPNLMDFVLFDAFLLGFHTKDFNLNIDVWHTFGIFSSYRDIETYESCTEMVQNEYITFLPKRSENSMKKYGKV